MPSLSSFVNSTQYSKENLAFPFVAAMKLGTGYTYTAPIFNGVNNATSVDPSLFGWLIYARNTFYTPAKGSTTDHYILYNTPYELVGDLNKLSGITQCLITTPGCGGTYGFFEYGAGTENGVGHITALENGDQFLAAINYMAYGGSLVIAGNVEGFNDYIKATENYFDVVIDRNHDSTVAKWLAQQQYTIGIYPSIKGSDGLTGSGYTMANFTSLFGNSSYVTGVTIGKRVFNVCGIKNSGDITTNQLLANTQINYTLPATYDVAGFFARSKNRNELYLTVAGLERSTIINGTITNSISWTNSLKTTLRNNKVNFFVDYNPKFLGSDLVGATASDTVTVNDRIGPANMRAHITQAINDVAMKYVYSINNQTLRDQVITEVQTALDTFSPFLDTTKTEITCDATNNDDNGSQLKIDVVVKPILATESFTINFSYSQ